jgi:hypothetical protein
VYEGSFSPHPRQHLLLVFLMIAILTGVRWDLNMVLICISFMARDVEYFICVFWSFVLLPLRNLCLVHLPISSLGHWFGRSLVFWAPCIFGLLIPCQMYSWQRFYLILWAASSVWWPFLLWCRSFLISCSPICQSFFLVARPFEFYWGSHCLCLLIPVYSLLFLALASKFQVLC